MLEWETQVHLSSKRVSSWSRGSTTDRLATGQTHNEMRINFTLPLHLNVLPITRINQSLHRYHDHYKYHHLCGNKMPTRWNRFSYCRSYCLLNMFRAPLCPTSGAQEYYTVVAAGGISCCGFQVAGMLRSWGLCVQFAGCLLVYQQPLYNTLELLMMGIVMPETCWASNKICNKKPLLHLVGISFPHINNDAWLKSHKKSSPVFLSMKDLLI